MRRLALDRHAVRGGGACGALTERGALPVEEVVDRASNWPSAERRGHHVIHRDVTPNNIW
jgi:hypothetical protein